MAYQRKMYGNSMMGLEKSVLTSFGCLLEYSITNLFTYLFFNFLCLFAPKSEVER